MFNSKSCEFHYFSSSPTRLSVRLIVEKLFAHRYKAFLLIDEKGERDFVFASAKNGNECDPKILPSSSSFLNLFSLTPIGVFVCSFVCLFTRARGSIRKVFICITLQHLFWYTKNAVFATQFAHCFCTQFAHYFCTQICGVCCTKTSPFFGIKMQKTKHKIERMRTQKQTLPNEKQTF